VKGRRIVHFLRTDIWQIQDTELAKPKAFLVRQARILLLSFRGLFEDKCKLRASALTFYSLLSLVPVLAMLFGVAKGFGIEKLLQKQLIQNLEAQEEVISRVITFATTLLENTRGGLMVGAGLLFLFWTTLNVLSNIEDAFNEIWGVKKARTVSRKLVDYLALTVIGPFLVVISGTLTVVVTGKIKGIAQRFGIVQALGPAVIYPLKFAPYAVLWLLFIFMYSFMPNTKVRSRSAIFGGIIAGTLFQLFQWVYINFQIGVARYNAIYGSFAALPLFLIWLNWSWLIVLYGAEMSFAHQNVSTFEYEKEWSRISYYRKKILALAVTHHLVKAFSNGEGPQEANKISTRLGIPIRCVREILGELLKAGVISQVSVEGRKGDYFQPALDPDNITIARILQAIERVGSEKIPIKQASYLDKLVECLSEMDRACDACLCNLKLKQIE